MNDHDARTLVTARHAYLDTVKLYLNRYVDDVELACLALRAGSIIRLEAMLHQSWWPAGLLVHQPTTELLRYVANAFTHHIVSRVDASLDLTTMSREDSACLMHFIEGHLVQRRRAKKQPVLRYITTIYYARAKARNNIAMYADCASKVNGSPCFHMDWRITKASAVRAAGIHSVDDLLRLDLRSFWEKRLLLRDYPSNEDLNRLGKNLRGQPRRKGVWKFRVSKDLVEDGFVRLATNFLRSTDTPDGLTLQQRLDLHGAAWSKYFPEISCTWMLPPHD